LAALALKDEVSIGNVFAAKYGRMIKAILKKAPLKLIWRWPLGLAVAAFALVGSAFLIEWALEYRDVRQLMPGQTFAKVDDARIRYKLVNSQKQGAVVVILSGLNGSIEQADNLQQALANDVPSLAYDRAGSGFSEGSTAHTVEEQARELAGLLRALQLEAPVVLIGYSSSGGLARVFAARFPERTAAIYLIEPSMPELEALITGAHSFQRSYVRFIVYHVVASSLGYLRFNYRKGRWLNPAADVEKRAFAVLVRRPHYWSMAREWYAAPLSKQQVLAATLPATLRLEVAFAKPEAGTQQAIQQVKVFRDFVASTNRGSLLELAGVRHEDFTEPGPAFDQVVARIKQFSQLAIQQ
jgi:pimeloyl-ACP methyl ester carboxylesterase